ncbi:nitrogen fixation protein NifZ [Roseibium aggregatum]|uniref:nitrogen fixation protein NifZ n=1 Tax=Roseibium aggregatum TaxID=187304 RepID=UPI003A97F210
MNEEDEINPVPGNLPLEPRMPKYDWGQRVQAEVDLRNDGSFPGEPEDALLVGVGDMGEIVQVGMHTDTNTPVYLVEFVGERVVGCLEEEISRI